MPKEREFLHESVIAARPNIVLEVGTWKGGGSTWQILEALKKNGSGMLYTCETDNDFFRESKELYGNDPQIEVCHESSESLISGMIQKNLIPDFIFFDGPEDADTAFKDFITLDPLLKSGCVFMMHDFDPPSIKATKIRPFLLSNVDWNVNKILTLPESVGLCHAVKI